MPLDAPSPTPSSITNVPSSAQPKRPRPSAMAAPAAGPSRAKRRKGDDGADAEDGGYAGKGKQPVNFGVGMVKGKEDEFGEPSDVSTKIDFNTLPDDTLYKYLEYHDLLPRWTTSPWSEEPCTPPNALYLHPSHLAAVPIVPEAQESTDASQENPNSAEPSAQSQPPPQADQSAPNDSNQPVEATANDAENPEGDEEDDEEPIAPTTRSKTAPFRKVPTPPAPTIEIKRGVITLSDVAAARAVLAEKANSHWAKGLGGGQNKESETIVNFLYKMKVGPGKLLKVYNPFPPPSAY